MSHPPKFRVATFNVSMEASNYLPTGSKGLGAEVLAERLATGTEPQIRNIAEIIQRTLPDILLLNEFDYIASPEQGVLAFIQNYLLQPQNDQQPIDYPYFFYAPVNSGLPSPFDLNRSGKATGTGPDAWGFGYYPGQYGMLVLSRYPIEHGKARTFQHFKWKDMPNHTVVKTSSGEGWYSPAAWQRFPLSSKSHWDVPVLVDQQLIHILVSHPTPPVFDGKERRNAMRNHDEIRFWHDYINGASYIYDDNRQYGGLSAGQRFVVAGDLNACVQEGDAKREAMQTLLTNPLVQGSIQPVSRGAVAHSSELLARSERSLQYVQAHTASWRMRADYVLPSSYGIEVTDCGVFWPAPGEVGEHLVADRRASSDHRLVWLDMQLG